MNSVNNTSDLIELFGAPDSEGYWNLQVTKDPQFYEVKSFLEQSGFLDQFDFEVSNNGSQAQLVYVFENREKMLLFEYNLSVSEVPKVDLIREYRINNASHVLHKRLRNFNGLTGEFPHGSTSLYICDFNTMKEAFTSFKKEAEETVAGLGYETSLALLYSVVSFFILTEHRWGKADNLINRVIQKAEKEFSVKALQMLAEGVSPEKTLFALEHDLNLNEIVESKNIPIKWIAELKNGNHPVKY